ncbi:GNAT family N-acetyltransferase [Streptosporangium subroseum]|jgi:GNAT superfamily N-acetyltransferase|uniref:Ribosomal protein S18 acetylase RimI n=1 Tax=Streptosporangium subroseum TaxID=106412 RepID=A0A239BDF5_9ACTN|nr:GNAT family N-acetyltransferase [Streptosporangium subroseum]WSA19423.1 GNAT family N-acetyltransferase [Streptosporangium subroseum]SNS05124.1 Ribosomal protein S18 acetylase RimI [Streptosporangium subroseum]
MIRPATPDDVPAIIDMIRGLAEYEKALDKVETTAEQLHDALFGASPAAFCHIATDGDRVAGYALWFVSYSTWRGKHGIYLEDLFVHPDHRGRGHGKELLIELAGICVERDYGRFEWAVLNWNTPAIEFYRSLGAAPLDEWITYRITGSALDKLAAAESTR